MANEQAPTLNDHGDETHPAFGVASVSRTHGTGRSLFQSDLLHNDTVRLSIATATRNRKLGRDWIYDDAELITVEMSLSQWGELVSSVGSGSGVPVTILRRADHDAIPSLPFAPRTATARQEVRDATSALLEKVTANLAALTEAIEEKRGMRAIREALGSLQATVANAPANAAFVVESFEEAATAVYTQAIADIEAAAASRLGSAGLSSQAAAIADTAAVPALDAGESGTR